MSNQDKKQKFRDPENFTLVLCFDTSQNSESLQFVLRNHKAKIVNLIPSGPTAGTFNFVKNDTLGFEVEVTGDDILTPLGEIDIEIVNCTLVSIKPPTYTVLSLFNKFNAIQSIDLWERVIDNKQPNICKFIASERLTVTASEGQWKISGYLSVKLFGDVAKLYYFDPEGSAGAGLGTEQ